MVLEPYTANFHYSEKNKLINPRINWSRQSLLFEILSRILRYFGRGTRVSSLELLSMQGKGKRKNSTGKSSVHWFDLIKTLTNHIFVDCLKLAKDREQWRNLMHEVLGGDAILSSGIRVVEKL